MFSFVGTRSTHSPVPHSAISFQIAWMMQQWSNCFAVPATHHMPTCLCSCWDRNAVHLCGWPPRRQSCRSKQQRFVCATCARMWKSLKHKHASQPRHARRHAVPGTRPTQGDAQQFQRHYLFVIAAFEEVQDLLAWHHVCVQYFAFPVRERKAGQRSRGAAHIDAQGEPHHTSTAATLGGELRASHHMCTGA